ncbi:MAG TPA: serine/threonine-protein kinase [Anaerolineae bacterium]|nr:serine/threonine-protein kinase [Anaerolineae bacterium]
MTWYKIGRYEIREELGRGGMATVFRAYDPRFQRDVALKIIPKEFLHDPSFVTRFQREAQTIAILEHPAIVPVYDFGEEDGQPFLVMRYLPGGSLTDRLAQGPLAWDESLRLISRLAPALDEAHKQGIIHRDLKPDNILFDHHDEPYLTDFGIAKLTEDRSQVATTGNVIIGTPAYMSPEQANGEDLDGRSDLYSLGVILFQMLTGRLPFEANSPIGVIMQHLTQPVPDINAYRPNLPGGCAAVIQRVLSKLREERYNTAVELSAALVEAPHIVSVVLPTAQPHSPVEPVLEPAPVVGPVGTPVGGEETTFCPKCKSPNDDQSQFCATCGTQILIGCPLCHTPNPATNEACLKCGANLKQLAARRLNLQKSRRASLAKRDLAFKEKAARQILDKLQTAFNDLNSLNGKKRALSQEYLEKSGNFVIKTLVDHMLSESEADARCASMEMLSRLYDRPEINLEQKSRIIKALVDAIEDPAPEVRQEAEALLEKYGKRRSREISAIFKGLVDWFKGE